MTEPSSPTPNNPKRQREPKRPRTILGLPVLAFFLILTPLAVVIFVGICTAIVSQRS